MNTQIEAMLKRYDLKTTEQYENALKELIQEIALSGLARAGFFREAAFCGGTALRIFHGLERFSEDLDFALLKPNPAFDMERFFPTVKSELLAYGFEMSLEKKKKTDSAVQSAFLKGNTQKLLLQITPLQPPVAGIMPTQKTRIKLEVDTNPPMGAGYEYRYSLLPMPYHVKMLDLPSMFSGKIHAILCSDFIKGRDLYDFVWYLQRKVLWNQNLLYHALRQTEAIPESENFGEEEVKKMLADRFWQIDFKEAKRDVRPFIGNEAALDIWSADFFTQIMR